ncbi:hypothetical protein BN844_3238 [Pseudomonas sp. SHC52]|nr:hypothetical protein BN844_3238 [Pseudomonas sp. SHC52]
MAVDHALDDTQRASEPARIVGDIGQGQEGFGGVHVAVGAAIGFLDAPVTVEGLAQRAFFFAPEMPVDDSHRLVQQRLGAGTLGHHGGTGGQGHEGMQVGGLAGVVFMGLRRGKPAAVFSVPQGAAEGLDAVVHQLGEARQALGVGHGEAVGHAGGVHGFGPGPGRQATALVQVAETVRQPRRLGERQQPQTFGGEPLLVGRCVQPTAEGRLEGVHQTYLFCCFDAGSLNKG